MESTYLRHAYMVLSGIIDSRIRNNCCIHPKDITTRRNKVTLFGNRSVEFYGDGTNPPTSAVYTRTGLGEPSLEMAEILSETYNKGEESSARFNREKGELEVSFTVRDERNLSLIKSSIENLEAKL